MLGDDLLQLLGYQQLADSVLHIVVAAQWEGVGLLCRAVAMVL